MEVLTFSSAPQWINAEHPILEITDLKQHNKITGPEKNPESSLFGEGSWKGNKILQYFLLDSAILLIIALEESRVVWITVVPSRTLTVRHPGHVRMCIAGTISAILRRVPKGVFVPFS